MERQASCRLPLVQDKRPGTCSSTTMDAAVHAALKERGVLVTHDWLDALSAARPALLSLPAAQQVRSWRLDPHGVGTTLGRRNETVVARGRPCMSTRFVPTTPRTAPAFAVSRTCGSLVPVAAAAGMTATIVPND
jgi:hypothetical protein